MAQEQTVLRRMSHIWSSELLQSNFVWQGNQLSCWLLHSLSQRFVRWEIVGPPRDFWIPFLSKKHQNISIVPIVRPWNELTAVRTRNSSEVTYRKSVASSFMLYAFVKETVRATKYLTCDPLIGSDLLINSDSDSHAHFKAGQIGQQRTPFFFFSNL